MVWSVLGGLAYTSGRILIVIILTRFYPSDTVGMLLFAMAVVTPLSFLINMELRSVYVTDTRDTIRPGHCLTLRLISNAVFISILIVVCVAASNYWGRQQSWILLLAGALRAAESWGDIYLGVFQKYEQMRRWAISQTIKTALILLWVLGISLTWGNFPAVLAGWAVGTLGVIFFYDRTWASQLVSVQPLWDRAMLGRLFRAGAVLGAFVVLSVMNHHVAQYFIKHELNYASVAYFGILMMYVGGLATIQNGINQAVLWRLSRYYVENRRRFRPLVVKLLGWTWLVMICGLAVVHWQGEAILRLLHGAEYAQHASLFVLVLIACGFMLTGMILGDAVIATGRFKSRLIAVATGLAVNAILCGLMIPPHGLTAAAWAAIVSSAVTASFCAAVLIGFTRRRK
ncbi:MAG: hypothetical protein IID32_02670 [Planctomycetes bacterium]|nr:hypothetical protein [Planctomycetota bacterium]